MHSVVKCVSSDNFIGVVFAAYILAVLGGNTSPSADDLKKILGSVGAEANGDRIELMLSQMKGKDLTDRASCFRKRAVVICACLLVVAAQLMLPHLQPVMSLLLLIEQKEDKVEESDNEIFTLFDDEV